MLSLLTISGLALMVSTANRCVFMKTTTPGGPNFCGLAGKTGSLRLYRLWTWTRMVCFYTSLPFQRTRTASWTTSSQLLDGMINVLVPHPIISVRPGLTQLPVLPGQLIMGKLATVSLSKCKQFHQAAPLSLMEPLRAGFFSSFRACCVMKTMTPPRDPVSTTYLDCVHGWDQLQQERLTIESGGGHGNS